jgi:excinuclease ABC subunit A
VQVPATSLPPGETASKDACATLRITNAAIHNLRNISVEIPLGRFVCITGVSGSGKTTLARDVLLPALESKLKNQEAEAENREPDEEIDEAPALRTSQSALQISGWENLSRVLLVDQSPLGKTPRSNPAVYIGAFDDIRELFAQTDLAKQRGLNASAFSFNSAQGQCEKCRGAGFEKIEMQFLSDIFIRCPECNGRRYRPHILEVKLSSKFNVQSSKSFRLSPLASRLSTFSIADLLEATVDEAIDFLFNFSESRHAQRALEKLKFLQEVGLGYLRLGQPINTLSGGESQRLKLVSHLADSSISKVQTVGKPTLFLFDEPTTGLHFEDVRVLLKVFQRLVEAGHSLVVIEHNLDVIKSADWIIDLGPEGGNAGGTVVIAGTPEMVTARLASHTGRALKAILPS